MAIYICEKVSGRLESYCPDDLDPVAPADVLEAKGLEAHYGLAPQDDTHKWDEASRSVVEVPAVLRPNIVNTAKWVMQFAPGEFGPIRASADPGVQHFLFALTLAPTVNLNDPDVIAGLNYLTSQGLLTQVRMTALQTWTEGA